MDNDALRPLFEVGARAWPTVYLRWEDFAASAHTTPDEHLLPHLERHAADLYLSVACATGDPEAIRLLNGQVLPQIAGAIGRIDGDPEFIDEALQVLREKLLLGPSAKIRTYAGRGPLVAWLRVAATRVALDLVRARSGARQQADTLPTRLAQDDESPLRDVVRAQYAEAFQKALDRAIASLTPRDRNILRLHLVARANIDDIGNIYGVHRTTAARWLQAARTHVFDWVRRDLCASHQLTDPEFASIARGVQSVLYLGLTQPIEGEPAGSGAAPPPAPTKPEGAAH